MRATVAEELVYIEGVGSYAPHRSLSNEELTTFLDTSDKWIRSHTGIGSRHIAAPNECASDMACRAVEKALSSLDIDLQSIDTIIVATSTPDYPGFPSTACVVQQKLKINNAASFDISAACSGFIYGIEVGRALIAANSSQRLLFICSEIFSRVVDWNDRSTCVLFGDGAAAIVLSRSPDNRSGIIDSVLMADGSQHTVLTLGDRPPEHDPIASRETEVEPSSPYLKMDGKRVYLFAVSSLIETVNLLLERNSLTIQDIRWIIPHQANERIINAACRRVGYDQSKFYTNIVRYANTSAASIPLALDEIYHKGLLSRGDKIITVGFGSGLTYGGNLIVW